MKRFYILGAFLLASVFSQAQSLTGLEQIMKDQVGAPFKIVFTHIVKQGQIDPAGSTLAAAIQSRDGLIQASSKAPSNLLDSKGELKDSDSLEVFKRYQAGMRAMVIEVSRLVEILSANAKGSELAQLEAAKAQVQIIVRGQKKAHEEFKEE